MQKNLTCFAQKIYHTLKANVPKGKVISYKQLAVLAGFPKSYRAIGNVLHKNPFWPDVPCHRVVNSKGYISQKFAYGGINAQKRYLLEENIKFIKDFQVDLKYFQND